MSFQMKKLSVGSLSVLVVSLLTMIITAVCLNVTDLLFWIFFTINLICVIIDSAFLVWIIIQENKNKRLLNLINKAQKESDSIILAGYGSLGIPPQYDSNGKLIDVYEFMGFLPEFDEDGNRLLTIYEMLGFNPKFNKKLKEIPNIFAIKHYASKVAKLKNPELLQLLTRKMSVKEKEMYENEQLLKQACKEKGIPIPASAIGLKKDENKAFKVAKLDALKYKGLGKAISTYADIILFKANGSASNGKKEEKKEGKKEEKKKEPEEKKIEPVASPIDENANNSTPPTDISGGVNNQPIEESKTNLFKLRFSLNDIINGKPKTKVSGDEAEEQAVDEDLNNNDSESQPEK